jgi:hypothetical protein
MNQRTPAVVAVAFFLLSACTTNNEASRQTVSSAEPNVVELSIDGHTFKAPDTLEAGWTTFKFANNGDDIHYAHIVRRSLVAPRRRS